MQLHLSIVAILLPLVSGQSELSLAGIMLTTCKALLFFTGVIVFAVWIFPKPVSNSKTWGRSLSAQFGLHNLLAFSDGKVATLAILTIAILFSILAHYFSLHPAVGAYMAGLIMSKEYFYGEDSRGTINTYKKTRKIIDNVAFAWIWPVFFVNLGG